MGRAGCLGLVCLGRQILAFASLARAPILIGAEIRFDHSKKLQEWPGGDMAQLGLHRAPAESTEPSWRAHQHTFRSINSAPPRRNFSCSRNSHDNRFGPAKSDTFCLAPVRERARSSRFGAIKSLGQTQTQSQSQGGGGPVGHLRAPRG